MKKKSAGSKVRISAATLSRPGLPPAQPGAPSITTPPTAHLLGEVNTTITIDIDLIDPSPFQPRFNVEETLDPLIDSLKETGGKIYMPPQVRPSPTTPGRYELIAGERRWRSAMNRGHRHIRCSLHNVDDNEALLMASTENMQRLSLRPFEIACVLERLIKSGLYPDVTNAGTVLGLSKTSAFQYMRLLDLPEEAKAFLRKHPDLIGPSAADDVVKVLKAQPACAKRLTLGLDLVLDGQLQAQHLANYLTRSDKSVPVVRFQRHETTWKGQTVFVKKKPTPSGRVQLVLEADPEVVERFLSAHLPDVAQRLTES